MWKIKKEIIQVGDIVHMDVHKSGTAIFHEGINHELKRHKLSPIGYKRLAATEGQVIRIGEKTDFVTWDVKGTKIGQLVPADMLILAKKGGGSACGH